jgi:hypothetical protein
MVLTNKYYYYYYYYYSDLDLVPCCVPMGELLIFLDTIVVIPCTLQVFVFVCAMTILNT